jgi:hypothetical protein
MPRAPVDHTEDRIDDDEFEDELGAIPDDEDDEVMVFYLEDGYGQPIEMRLTARDAVAAVRYWEVPYTLPAFAPPGFGSLVDILPHPPLIVTIGNFERETPPPWARLTEGDAVGWTVFHHQDLLSFPHGRLGQRVLHQIADDDAQLLIEHTRYAPNLLVYKTRLRILYRLIGEIAFYARMSRRLVCVIFIILYWRRMKILNELVAAHGSQLKRCTTCEQTQSWVLFDGTEELADNFTIDDAVERAASVTMHGLIH